MLCQNINAEQEKNADLLVVRKYQTTNISQMGPDRSAQTLTRKRFYLKNVFFLYYIQTKDLLVEASL